MGRQGVRRDRAGWLAGFLAVAAVAAPLAARVIIVPSSSSRTKSTLKIEPADPANDGLAKLICASPYGGEGNDRIEAVRILPDHSILLSGNFGMTGTYSGGGKGFLVRLKVTDDKTVSPGRRADLPGTLNNVKTDAGGNIYVLLDSAAVYHILPGAREPTKHCVHEGIKDFAVDSNGELLILCAKEIIRYDASWEAEKWKAPFHAYGTGSPQSLSVCGASGVASVIGYGKAHTGRERWSGPFAHGFDRAGKNIWTLWDQKPDKQLSKKDGGNGLTADTCGTIARTGADGRMHLALHAENELSICTRDPKDSDRPIDKAVFKGVHQDNPGKGFRGSAKRTSVAFRVDAATGELQKGTWLCAWLREGKSASYLHVTDLVTDEKGRLFTAGGTQFGGPTKDPWYFKEGGYKGGGFLSVFDGKLKMLQSGFFTQTAFYAVDAAHGYAVVGGLVMSGRSNPETPLNVYQPIQRGIAGGLVDAYFAVFVTGPHGTPQALPTKAAPAPADGQDSKSLLAQAMMALENNQPAVAKAKLEAVLSKHPNTSAARQAKVLLAQLAAKPAPTPTPTPTGATSQQDEKAANRLLQKAENYLANRMKPLAKKSLKQLAEKYPKTEAAKRARELLDEHFPDE